MRPVLQATDGCRRMEEMANYQMDLNNKKTCVDNFVIRLHSLLPSAIRTDNHTIPVVDHIYHGMVHESTTVSHPTSKIANLIEQKQIVAAKYFLKTLNYQFLKQTV